MKRLEDRLKDHFDHFQPEVDPAVWQQITQQLPGGPITPAGKGVSSFVGAKAVWIAGGLAAAVIAGIVLYQFYVSDTGSNPALPTPSEQVIQQPIHPGGLSEEQFLISSPTEEEKAQNAAIKEPKPDPGTLQQPSISSDGQYSTNNKTAGQTALTGHTVPDKGGDTAAPPTPVQSIQPPSPPGQLGTHAPAAQPEKAVNHPVTSIKPVLILSAKKGFAPLTVTFMTNVEGQIADYDFGDGNATYAKLSATHRYEESGVFEVACTINGQVLRSSVSVTGRIPSAFSPNGDGVNDRFTIENPDNILLDIRIFSRSGQLVFTGKGYDVSWDGRLPSGDPAPEGTYLVHILAPSFEGATHQQKATIQLFR